MLRRFSVDGLVATPWKNGGGSTREIASWPEGAGLDGFDWRCSIATIASSGPFSVFPGIDRTILLLRGDGVRLLGEGVDHRLDQPLQPFAFSGDVPVDCTLLGGASSDFNVMTRRGRFLAELQIVEQPGTLAAAEHGVLLSLDGRWQANDVMLGQGDGVYWRGGPVGWRLAPASRGARLVAVRWLQHSQHY